jgi:hypothetical protein
MNIKELGVQSDVMLTELASYIPEWDEEQTVLLRMVAARLMRESGVSPEVGRAVGAQLNSLIKQGITFGYALREYDLRNGIQRAKTEPSVTAFFSPRVIQAA